MDDELWIRIRAEFVQIEALSLAIQRDTIRDETVEHPVQSVRHGENESEQRGYAHDLGCELTRTS